MRLDTALVIRGLSSGRDKAKHLVADGFVTVNGKMVTKPSFCVCEDDCVVCFATARYVGRGGEKLEKVFVEYGLSVQGAFCADIGASTGGFTDCLLQHGAHRVYAVDVGHGQLHDSLRADPRVVCMEGTDIRNSDAVSGYIPAHSIQACVVDVSFISLKQIWDSLPNLLADDATVICLIKPQFEAGRSALSKRGVVRSGRDHERVLCDLLCFWKERGWFVNYLSWSPIFGGDGNTEYLAALSRKGTDVSPVSIPELVKQAASALAVGSHTAHI